MRLLAPASLHLLWLTLVPLVLWLFRRRARQVTVSTLLFFRTLAREHHESAWLRAIKKWLSLALTLLVLLTAVFALARPSREASAGSPAAVVLIVDCSASMGAKDSRGSRLDEAKARARARFLGLPDNVVVSLLAFAARPEVLLSRSRNHRECIRLIDSLTVRPEEGRADAAVVAARRIAALDPGAEVWLISDHTVPDVGVQFANVALPAPVNAGITAFQIRKAPLSRDRYEAFVKITAAASNALTVSPSLEARIDGRVAQLRELDLKPGESASLVLPLEGVHGQLLEVEVKCPGDCFPWDDACASPLPVLRPLVVAWIADKPDPFTDLAMGSLVEAGRVDVLRGKPADWPLKDEPDVFVFENWLPDAWPANRPVLALLPPKSSGPLHARALPQGLPAESVRVVNGEHAVVHRVISSRLSLTQHSVIETPALQTLWSGGDEPLLCAGELGGQRVVVTAFSPARSEQLALLPAFPLLLGNAIYWCAEGSDAAQGVRPLLTGEVMAPSGPLQWRAWDGANFVSATDEPSGGLLELRRIGAWQTADGNAGSCVLASQAETDLPKRSGDATEPGMKMLAGGMSWPQRLIWFVLVLLIADSWLLHRKAVY